MNRVFFLFDTSSIPDTDTIDSAIMSVFNLDNNGDNDPIGIVQSSPASNTALTVDDYDQAGAINNAIEGATRASSFVNNTYIDFTLNNTGKGWISKIGISKFALRMARDLDNTIPSARSYRKIQTSEAAGTTQDPKLVVVHSAPTPTPTPTPTDTTAPSGSISINSGASYTNSTTVTLNLSATDSVGVTGYYLSDSSSTPSASASGWTSVTSTTSYSATVSYSLSSGEGSKTIYAWYKDAAGNVSSTANATITLDTTVPTVTISSPTSSSTYTSTSSTISMGGSASDSSSGISSVAWSNDRGGNGTATGTASWTVSSISLSTGNNVITLTARDGAGNSGTDTITVTQLTCTYTISSSSQTFGSSGGSGSVSVTSLSGCLWTATSNASWITITSGSSGSGNGTVSYSVSSNTDTSSRTGTMTIVDQTFTVTQSGINATPTPQTSPTPATTPVPTPTTAQKGVIVGTVADEAAGVGIASTKIILDKGGYSATTGFDGSYTIVDVSAGNYTLTASADGYKSSSQTVTVYAGEATVADFLLKRASEGIVFGFVIDEDSNPLKGVTVTITVNNSSGNTETDDDGYYEFRDLEAGGYTLTFEKSGYRTQTLDIILKAGEALEAETITMELEVKGSIFGYVVDISGNPIESVRLKLKGIKTKIKRNASSDADGFFEFADLDADKYVIFASKKRYKKTKQTVSLDEGDDQKIEIEMGKSSSSRRVIPEAEE